MKGKMKLLAGALLATLALGVFVAKAYAQGNVPKSDELSGDIPAAEIACDGGSCGWCFVYTLKSDGFGPGYDCLFSGRPNDYCDCGWVVAMGAIGRFTGN